MQQYKHLKLITCLLVLLFTANSFADEAQTGEGASKTDCPQCDEMCGEPEGGKSIKPVNSWICQQCLQLCEEQNTPDEPIKDMGSSPCPMDTT